MSEHAISNARAWADTIREAMAAMAELKGGAESIEFDGDTFEDTDSLRERLEEMPLSVQVRGGWHSPGDTDGLDAKPEEFELLLSTGGPALRIIGKLDGYGSVEGWPDLQWQDWGTPWTNYNDTTTEQSEAIQTFAALFYYGE